MKKTSTTITEMHPYSIQELINHTAVVKSVTGKMALVNIKTGQTIGDCDWSHTRCCPEEQLYIQQKKCQSFANDNDSYDYALTIYDALEEKLIVDGWRLIRSFDNFDQLCILESPEDHKLHIFDRSIYRTQPDFLQEKFDHIELLYRQYSEIFLKVSQNKKQKIFQIRKGIITNEDFDDIRQENNITIFTKNGEKFFKDSHGSSSVICEEITFDENNKDIVYCKKGNTIFVYNLDFFKLLFQVDCDKLKFLSKNEGQFNYRCGELFFSFQQAEKWGLLSIEITPEVLKQQDKMAEVNNLLEAQFDDIYYNSSVFHLKNGKVEGLFKKLYPHNIYLEPNYDKIDSLDCDFFAFYQGDLCDIYKIRHSLQPIITQCKIVENQDKGLIFIKNDSFGLLTPGIRRNHHDEDIVLESYHNITHLGNHYFRLDSKDGKGVCYRGQIIIPLDNEAIDFHFSKLSISKEMVHFSLKKKDGNVQLAKKTHYYSSDTEVEIRQQPFEDILFLNDIMVLKDQAATYIYTYEDTLIKTFPAGVEVSMSILNSNFCNSKCLYSIDGTSYFFKDGQLEKALMEECDLYVTTYEGDFGSVVVSSYNQGEHDTVCKQIEAGGEDKLDQTISSIYEENPGYRVKEPMLIKRVLPTKPSDSTQID